MAQAPIQPQGQTRKKRRATGRFECQLGLFLGLGGLIGSRLGQLWIAFDVFSQFSLQFAVITAAFFIGLLLPRARLLGAFLVIIIGLLGVGIWPHLASRAPMTLGVALPGETVLKVASFNTLWENQQVDAVIAEILRLDADVISLIEMAPNKHRIIAAVKDRYPYHTDCYDLEFCNFVIFSKLPIVESSARALWDGPPFIRAKLGPEAGGLTVLGVHTIRFPHSRAQFRQITEMGKVVEKLPGRKLVLGDFNATPFSRIMQSIEDRANLRRLTSLPSWPTLAGLPQIAIDHILVSPGIKVIESQQIGEPAGSDHYPISLKIAVPVLP